MGRRAIAVIVLVVLLALIGAGLYIRSSVLPTPAPVALQASPTNLPESTPSHQPTLEPTLARAALPSPASVPTSSPTSLPTPLPTEEPLATLPPPLSAVLFPTQRIDYPADWPAELHYPEAFTLVEAHTGSVPDNGAPGWAVKLRYNGDPNSAAELMTTFFTKHGWSIMDRIEQQSSNLTLLFERDNRNNSGVVEIEQDTSDTTFTKITAVVFP